MAGENGVLRMARVGGNVSLMPGISVHLLLRDMDNQIVPTRT